MERNWRWFRCVSAWRVGAGRRDRSSLDGKKGWCGSEMDALPIYDDCGLGWAGLRWAWVELGSDGQPEYVVDLW